MESRARCAGFSVTEIGNRKERLRVREAGASAAGRGQRPYASFPGFLPLNPLRTPSPPLKRAGTPCTRERGLRPGLTALRGASGGWVTGFEPVHITAFADAKTLVENEKGWFDHPFFSLPNTTGGCNASMSCNRTQPAVATPCFLQQKQRLRKTVVLRSLLASAGTLFGAVIRRL